MCGVDCTPLPVWVLTRSCLLTPCSLCYLPQAKKKKNISHDAFGTTFGRVHMQKQDLSKLRTRKMKGLRKRKAQAAVGEQDGHAPKEARVAS